MTAARDITDEPDWEEITSVEHFRERVGGRYGVIVITDDDGRQPIAHHREATTTCVNEGNFTDKVIDGAGHTGRYFWAKNSGIAAGQLGARRCGHPGDKLSRS